VALGDFDEPLLAADLAVRGNAVAQFSHGHLGIQAGHALSPISRIETPTWQIGQHGSLTG